MTWKLPEPPNDFISKNGGAVGILEYQSPTKKNKVYKFPFKFSNILCNKQENCLQGEILTKQQFKTKVIPFSLVKDLSFPFPYIGLISIENSNLFYINKNMIKQYRRGWRTHTVSKIYPDIIKIIMSTQEYLINSGTTFTFPYNIVNPRPLSPTSPEIIDWVFNKNYNFIPLQNSIKYNVGALSPNFGFINLDNIYYLLYKTYTIGTLNPLNINKNLSFLEDVFYEEVNN